MRQKLEGVALASYERMKRKFMEKYGTVHLCGHCANMMSCKRMRIQEISTSRVKDLLMKQLTFVKNYKVHNLTEKKDIGFVFVFDCDNFEYEEF